MLTGVRAHTMMEIPAQRDTVHKTWWKED